MGLSYHKQLFRALVVEAGAGSWLSKRYFVTSTTASYSVFRQNFSEKKARKAHLVCVFRCQPDKFCLLKFKDAD